VDIDTLGLAGDSVVTVSRDRQLFLGPRRAVPLSVLAGEFESVVGELERIWDIRANRSSLIQPVEFFVAVRGAGETKLTDTERRTLDALAEEPKSRDGLAESIKVIDPSMVPTNRMETLGLIRRSALTPTDILHVRGIFTRWNTAAARLGLRLVADRLKIGEDALEDRIMETFTRQSVRYLVGRLLRHPGGKFDDEKHSPMLDKVDEGLTELLLSGKDKLGFSLKPTYIHPLIAIGAPAYALAPAVAQRLGAELVVPEHADVANAVGAITGMQTITVEAIVSATETGYLSYTPAERKDFEELESAMEWTKVRVMELLDLKIREEGQGGLEYQRELQVRDNVAQVPAGDFFLESAVRGVGFCKPALG
jgi:N-methylhydantoinase A/oxoprolinase/acetone carboxylase beta subunit